MYEAVKDHYNEVAEELGLPKCRVLTKTRLAQVKARVAEIGEDGLHEAIDNLRDSAFCQGLNPRGWRASFDFVMQASSCIKLLEGAYSDGPAQRKMSNLERVMQDAVEGTSGSNSMETDRIIPFHRRAV